MSTPETNLNDSAFAAMSEQYTQEGLTKREYCAIAVLQGLLTGHIGKVNGIIYPERLVNDAVTLTDELFKKLSE